MPIVYDASKQGPRPLPEGSPFKGSGVHFKPKSTGTSPTKSPEGQESQPGLSGTEPPTPEKTSE